MTHLKLLIREERVVAWCDRDIQAGKRSREEIDRALASARVGLLLVSPNFLASDFIMQDELPFLLEAADTRGVKLLWVLLSACLFDQTPIVELQAAYNPARPLAKLQGNQRDEALTAIAREVLKAVGEPERTRISRPSRTLEATMSAARGALAACVTATISVTTSWPALRKSADSVRRRPSCGGGRPTMGG